MDPKKKDRLEKKGWHVGTAEEFLDLTSTERVLLELRLQEIDEPTRESTDQREDR